MRDSVRSDSAMSYSAMSDSAMSDSVISDCHNRRLTCVRDSVNAVMTDADMCA